METTDATGKTMDKLIKYNIEALKKRDDRDSKLIDRSRAEDVTLQKLVVRLFCGILQEIKESDTDAVGIAEIVKLHFYKNIKH